MSTEKTSGKGKIESYFTLSADYYFKSFHQSRRVLKPNLSNVDYFWHSIENAFCSNSNTFSRWLAFKLFWNKSANTAKRYPWKLVSEHVFTTNGGYCTYYPWHSLRKQALQRDLPRLQTLFASLNKLLVCPKQFCQIW